ncbi:MAG: hypothetical protein OEY89_16350 [Gammaproteobacteria bacterium]|nr:hypothetical protein [Gammaproteobacteria bacterium]
MKNRHSQFDVSNSVRVSDTQAVCDAVCDIFHGCYLHADDSVVKRAFSDFDNLFEGNFKGYHSCDTIYHDKQHTLDMTLALARLIDGHERQSDSHHTFGAELTNLSIITALFHDSGYIRELHDQKHHNGAEYTRIHVSRSATFLRKYLTMIGLEKFADIAANMVHYTGYEVAPENIKLPDEKFHLLGYMIGTADLIAQMSDRCYLEKCRDRLYPEFELGGLTEIKAQNGLKQVIYASGEDLLNKTPEFYNGEVLNRLNTLFKKVYHFAGIHFGGKNLYMDSLQNNIDYVNQLIKQGEIEKLRRLPPENPASKILLRTHAVKAH